MCVGVWGGWCVCAGGGGVVYVWGVYAHVGVCEGMCVRWLGVCGGGGGGCGSVQMCVIMW